jgi:ATP-binding protein involved in chromosome partitioning
MDLVEKEKKIVEIIRALKKVNFPGYSRDIISFGFLKKVDVDDENNVFVDIEVSSQKEGVVEEIEKKAREVLSEISWINHLDLHVRKKEIFTRQKIPIKGKAIAIYSTKGGVGKSTVAVNLAFSFSILGLRASILDLDVHGPSIPKITGTEDYEPTSPDGTHIIPAEKDGVKIMSLGYMAKGGTPVVWRGPMVIKAFRTLLFSTLWPDTEILVLDMPPGSGDVQLSLAQEAQIDGIVMITTPQELALEDVRRGISMFKKLDVRILGVIENMSYFQCDCGKKHFIFGKQGGKKIAQEYNLDFLGEIPIDPYLMELSDRGEIFVLKADNKSIVKESFISIAKKILEKLEIFSAQ